MRMRARSSFAEVGEKEAGDDLVKDKSVERIHYLNIKILSYETHHFELPHTHPDRYLGVPDCLHTFNVNCIIGFISERTSPGLWIHWCKSTPDYILCIYI